MGGGGPGGGAKTGGITAARLPLAGKAQRRGRGAGAGAAPPAGGGGIIAGMPGGRMYPQSVARGDPFGLGCFHGSGEVAGSAAATAVGSSA